MRKKRKLKNGAKYHVSARINNGEFLLKSPEDKKLFRLVLKQAKQKFKCVIETYNIMDNHIHIMIKPLPGNSLSKIMQWILSVFTLRFNKKNGRTGSIWQDRFKSVIIKTLAQYFDTFKYINENPVKAKMVSLAENYPFSGLWEINKRIYSIVKPPNRFLMARFFL